MRRVAAIVLGVLGAVSCAVGLVLLAAWILDSDSIMSSAPDLTGGVVGIAASALFVLGRRRLLAADATTETPSE